LNIKTIYPHIFAYLEANTKEAVIDKAKVLFIDFTMIKTSNNIITNNKKGNK